MAGAIAAVAAVIAEDELIDETAMVAAAECATRLSGQQVTVEQLHDVLTAPDFDAFFIGSLMVLADDLRPDAARQVIRALEDLSREGPDVEARLDAVADIADILTSGLAPGHPPSPGPSAGR